MAERWLPPSAPGGQSPRRWDPEPPTPSEPAAPPATAPPSSPATPAPPVAAPPAYAPPTAFVQPHPPQPSNGQAVAGFVLGICGLAFLVLSVGILFVVSLPCSVLGWIFGVKGRRRADRDGLGQRGLAQAGLIMGVIGTVLGVLALVGWILVFALGDFNFKDLETSPGDPIVLVAGLLATLVGR